MNKYKLKTLSLIAVTSIFLTSCGGSASSRNKGLEFKEKIVMKNDGTPIKGGTFKKGMAGTEPLVGILSNTYNTDAYDLELQEPLKAPINQLNDDYHVKEDQGLITYKIDKNAKSVTTTISKDFKWEDGKPVVAKDFLYPYEIIGNKDYTGIRYDEDFQNIVGMEDYHNGKSKTISGIETPNDNTIIVKFKELKPSISYGVGFPGSDVVYPMPYHQLKDIPIKDLEKSDLIKTKILSAGPFRLAKAVQGQEYEYVPNPYYKNKPKLDKVVIRRISTPTVVKAYQSHEYDIISDTPMNIYTQIKEVKGYQELQKLGLRSRHIVFKVGRWDKDKSEIITNPKAKMNNKNLRQAMIYALDLNRLNERYYKGIAKIANSPILPQFKDVYDKDLKPYEYDKKKAEKLLDEAGYKIKKGEKFRRDPEGKPLVINYADTTGSQESEAVAQYNIQSWNDIGLDVRLTNGRLLEFNDFIQKMLNDDPNIDIAFQGWSEATYPSLQALYSKKSQINLSRYTDSEFENLIKEEESEKAAKDNNYRVEISKKLQEKIRDVATDWNVGYYIVPIFINKRVKEYTISETSPQKWEDIELLSNDLATK